MPRKGRQVELRHIFPWVAAPYIELLRLLWRIERFILSPFQYLQAWTVSAFFGIAGILLSVALFIPRLVDSQAVASPTSPFSRLDMPYIPFEEPVPPPSSTTWDGPDVQVRMERTILRDFDQNERILTESKPLAPAPLSALARRDGWIEHLQGREEPPMETFQSYIRRAAIHDSQLTHLIPEYHFDPGIGDFQSHRSHSAQVEIKKSIPRGVPDEPQTYIITVSNLGQDTISSTTVEEVVSDIQRVIDTDPPAQVTPTRDRLVWELQELLPSETRHLNVTIQPDRRHVLTQDTLAYFTTSPVIAETMVREKPQIQPVLPPEPTPEPEPVRRPEPTPAPAPVRSTIPGTPKLALEFDPPAPVRVGEEVHAYYTITNVGTADATQIRLLVEVPPELQHRFGELVEHRISRLAPNESRKALFAALAQKSGPMALHWTLECAELDNQSNSEPLAVKPPLTPTGTPRSSIPNTQPDPREPTPLSPEELNPNEPAATWTQPRPTYDTPQTIPARGRDPYGPLPAPGSSIPSSIPSSIRSTIPHWVDPSSVTDPAPGDWQGLDPITPAVTPEDPALNGPLTPPSDLPNLEIDSPMDPVPFKSTIPNGPAIPNLQSEPETPALDSLPGDSLPGDPLPEEPGTAPAFPLETPSEIEPPLTDTKLQ